MSLRSHQAGPPGGTSAARLPGAGATSAAALGLRLRALIWLVCALMAALLSLTPWSRGVDNRLHDSITAWSPAAAVPQGVVILEIDERTLSVLGPWPWPRPLLARVSEALRERGARVQVWDVLLPQDAPTGDPLTRTLSRPDVVLAQALVTDPSVRTPPADGRRVGLPAAPGGLCSRHEPIFGHIGPGQGLQAGQVGHINATPDPDGRLRRLPAVLCDGGQAFPQLALAAAQAATPEATWELDKAQWPWQPPYTLTRGAWRFPLESDGWMRVPYARPHEAWPVVSVESLLDPTARLPMLQGAVVLIGATALGLGDIVGTPLHSSAPGVSIHAEVIAAALPGVLPPAPSAGVVGGEIAARALHTAVNWPLQPAHGLAWAVLLALPGLLLVRRLEPQLSARSALGVTLAVMAAPVLLVLLVRVLGVGASGSTMLLPAWPATVALAVQALGSWMANAAVLRRESSRLARHLESFMPAALARRIAHDHPSSDSLGEPQNGTLLALRVPGIERWVSSVEPLQALGLIHVLNATVQNLALGLGGRLEHMQGHTLLLAWASDDASAVRKAMEVAQRCATDLGPLLRRNESETHPLGMNIAIESGSYLQGIVGPAEARRAVLIGPAATDALAMLELSDELASPVLLGPKAASHLAHSADVHRLGQFVLPQQAQSKPLFGYRLNISSGLTKGA